MPFGFLYDTLAHGLIKENQISERTQSFKSDTSALHYLSTNIFIPIKAMKLRKNWLNKLKTLKMNEYEERRNCNDKEIRYSVSYF